MVFKSILCIRVILLFSLFFSVFSIEAMPLLFNEKTEAGSSTNCDKGCSTENDIKDITDYHECLRKLNSDECQAVDKTQRITCEPADTSLQSYIMEGAYTAVSCVEFFGQSFAFLFKLLWSIVKFLGSLAVDTASREMSASYLSSVKNYVFIEFYKAYMKADGNQMEKALQALYSVGGDNLNMIFSGISDFLERQYDTFYCYNNVTRNGLICSMLVGVILPGGSLFNAIKVSRVAGQLVLQPAKGTRGLVDSFIKDSLKGRSVKVLSKKELQSLISSFYNKMHSRIIGSSKSLSRKAQNEIAVFVQKLDKDALYSFMEKPFREAIEQGRTGSSVFPTLVSGLLIANAGVILSKESHQFLVKEVSDILATVYVDEKMRNENQ